MMKTKKLALIAFLLVLLDQASKLAFQGKKYLLNGIGIEYATNTGAAFGILQGHNLILLLLSIAIICLIVYYYKKVEGAAQIGLMLLLSGAVGNLMDRAIFGHVRDFIAVYWWPNFNFADTYNVIGVLLLVLAEFRHKKP